MIVKKMKEKRENRGAVKIEPGSLYVLVPSASNLCKQFGPRSGQTQRRA